MSVSAVPVSPPPGGLSEVQLAHIREWCVRNRIALCWLYGSRATGQADDLSDWDIGVVFADRGPEHATVAVWLDLVTELDPVFPGQDVDLVFLDQASPALRNAAIQGRLLYAISEDARAGYLEETWRLWWDLKPFIEAQEREQREAILSGH